MKKLIVFLMITLCATYAYANGNGKGRLATNKNGNNYNGGLVNCLVSVPMADLEEIEIDALKYLIEEEKLARDVYLELYEQWGIRVFKNIARSEQNHMNALSFLFERYGLENPTVGNDTGVFINENLQTLYTALIEQGSTGMIESLQVGATIEDLDIKDLQKDITLTDNEDLQIVFQNLMKGSRNHLRSFVGLLEKSGYTYTAQYLTQEEIDQIVNSEKERGPVDANGDPLN